MSIDELKEKLEITSIVCAGVLVVTLALSLLCTPFIAIEYYSCKSQATAIELEYTWGPLQGCIVEREDGVKVNIDNYGRADRD